MKHSTFIKITQASSSSSSSFSSSAFIHHLILLLLLSSNWIRPTLPQFVKDRTTHLTAEDFERAEGPDFNSDEDATTLTDEDFENGNNLNEAELFPDAHKIRISEQWGKYHGDVSGKAAYMAKAKSEFAGARERAILARSINAYHQNTCVRFIPRNVHRDYVYIGKIDGLSIIHYDPPPTPQSAFTICLCFSDVGRAGGRQEVSLDDGCVEYDTAIHELMHAVGFWHEHERWDRDNFINVIWRNIDRDAYDQFGRVNLFESSYYNEKYDYYSIMHYDRRSFSKNGRDTMQAIEPGMTQVIGRVKNFSPSDLRKINKVYNCQSNNNAAAGGGRPTLVQTQRPYYTAAPITQRPTPTPTVSTACMDKASLCWRWVNRCRSPFFEQIMRQFCARTCGFCFVQQSNTSQFNQFIG